MPFVRAIGSRKFSWHLMLLGTCVGFVGGFFHYGWRTYPWAILPFVFLSIVLLHPVMEKDVPSLVGADMLREPRTYYGGASLVIALFILILGYHFPR
jgi:hypothetical protein